MICTVWICEHCGHQNHITNNRCDQCYQAYGSSCKLQIENNKKEE